MTSANERLRDLLDERGIEYDAVNEYVTVVYMDDRYITYLAQGNNLSAEVVYPRPVLNGTEWLTPEQAIAATLGGGKLTADDVLNAVYKHGARWQAIADELNAALGSGTCEMEIENDIEDMCGEHYVYLTGWTCSKCGNRMTSMYEDDAPSFCPACGARAKAVKR